MSQEIFGQENTCFIHRSSSFNIVIKAREVLSRSGSGTPVLGAYGLSEDDKRLLLIGSHHSIRAYGNLGRLHGSV